MSPGTFELLAHWGRPRPSASRRHFDRPAAPTAAGKLRPAPELLAGQPHRRLPQDFWAHLAGSLTVVAVLVTLGPAAGSNGPA